MCPAYQYHTGQKGSRKRWRRADYEVNFAASPQGSSAAGFPLPESLSAGSAGVAVLNEVLDLLKKYPQIKFEQRDYSVLVPPAGPEGFPVLIEQIWEGHYAVSFGGWQQDFSNIEEAVACFVMGLSNHCRLKVESKGKKPVRWTLEQLENADWKEISSRGSWSAQIFKQPVTSYLINDLVRAVNERAQEEEPVESSRLAS
jgi:hypothetical protein